MFLLTPERMVMAAAHPMRSSVRLEWRIWVCNPDKPTRKKEQGLLKKKNKPSGWINGIFLYSNVCNLSLKGP